MGHPFGRYELLKRLAAGGMGEGHLARQVGKEGFEKLLVVKVLLPHLVEDEEFLKMFYDEARIAASLNHPNIAQLFDFGEIEGHHYTAMEYIHGEDIVKLWKAARGAGKPVPIAVSARIIAEAAAGLDYAHKAVDANNQPLKLVHRDVSPQNILVTFDGGVKVIDFGIAKAAGSLSHTATGVLKGKYAYMSPEQADGKPIDHRSDVFALGVVLYEMLTSLRLFKRENETQTLRAVTDCEVEPPSTVNPQIDPQLDAIMLKVLAKDREQRYQDAQEFRLALEEWMVHTRQAGSAAHLSAYMRDLFAERLAKERELGRTWLDDASTPSGKSKTGFPGRSSLSSISVAVQNPTTASRPGALQSQGEKSAAAPPPKKSPVPLIAGGIAAVALLAGGAFFALRPAEQAAPPVVVQTPPAQVAMLNLATRPEGAKVLLDGVEIGSTPLMGHSLQAGKRAELEVTLDGYKPVKRVLSGGGIENLDLALERIEPVKAPDVVLAVTEEVSLQLVSSPPGAQVLLDGNELGKTPLSYKHLKGDTALSFQFRLAGHKPVTRTVTPLESAEVKAVLSKVKKGGGSKEPDPLDIKMGR